MKKKLQEKEEEKAKAKEEAEEAADFISLANLGVSKRCFLAAIYYGLSIQRFVVWLDLKD